MIQIRMEKAFPGNGDIEYKYVFQVLGILGFLEVVGGSDGGEAADERGEHHVVFDAGGEFGLLLIAKLYDQVHDFEAVKHFVAHQEVRVADGFVQVFERAAQVGEFLGVVGDFWQL